MKCLHLSTVALLTAALAAAQPVTGRWTGNFSTADNGLEIVVALNQSADGAVTGYILSPRSTDTITSGKIEGNNLTLEAERAGRGGAIQKVTYTATVEGGKMKLTVPAPNFGGPGRGRGGPGASPGGPPPAGRGPGGPGGGRGGQPQVIDLARVSTDVPKALPPRPEPVSLPMPTTAVKYNGMAKTPPMGWNSWNKFAGQRRTTMRPRDGRRHGHATACATPATSTSTSTTPGKATATPTATSAPTRSSPT